MVPLAISMDMAWRLVLTTFLLAMQLGFAVLETGHIGYQSKHRSSTLLKNVANSIVGIVVWCLIGQGLFAAQGPYFLGTANIIAYGSEEDNGAVFTHALFAITATTIVSGAVAERMDVRAYVLLVMLGTGIIYPVVARSVWYSKGFFTTYGSPWRLVNQSVGVIDTAGGGTIHCVGGVMALVSCIVVGQRQTALKVHYVLAPTVKQNSITLQVHGAFLLWLGFVALHSLSAVPAITLDPHMAAHVCLATVFGGCMGGMAALFSVKPTHRNWHTSSMVPRTVAGVLAGVVATSSTCFVAPIWSHAITSTLAGFAVEKVNRALSALSIDDVASVSGVHLCGGALSILSAAFFAKAEYLERLPTLPNAGQVQHSVGIVFGGDGRQLGIQLVWLIFLSMWTVMTTLPICLLLRAAGVLRMDIAPEGRPGGVRGAMSVLTRRARSRLASLPRRVRTLIGRAPASQQQLPTRATSRGTSSGTQGGEKSSAPSRGRVTFAAESSSSSLDNVGFDDDANQSLRAAPEEQLLRGGGEAGDDVHEWQPVRAQQAMHHALQRVQQGGKHLQELKTDDVLHLMRLPGSGHARQVSPSMCSQSLQSNPSIPHARSIASAVSYETGAPVLASASAAYADLGSNNPSYSHQTRIALRTSPKPSRESVASVPKEREGTASAAGPYDVRHELARQSKRSTTSNLPVPEMLRGASAEGLATSSAARSLEQRSHGASIAQLHPSVDMLGTMRKHSLSPLTAAMALGHTSEASLGGQQLQSKMSFTNILRATQSVSAQHARMPSQGSKMGGQAALHKADSRRQTSSNTYTTAPSSRSNRSGWRSSSLELAGSTEKRPIRPQASRRGPSEYAERQDTVEEGSATSNSCA